MKTIYLSYSATDRDFAYTVFHYFQQSPSFSVWIDTEELVVNDNWWAACADAHKNADIVVGIASINSIGLSRVLREWETAKRLFLISMIAPKDYMITMPENFIAYNVIFNQADNLLETLSNELLQISW